jgi:minor extracellular serine protease Vpr
MDAFPDEGSTVPELQRPVGGVRRSLAVGALALAGVAAIPAPAPADPARDLYLVTLDGPGLSGLKSHLPVVVADLRMLAEQERVLDSVGGPSAVYTWRAALNGFAVELTDAEAEMLAGHPDVALVEPNEVRPLASTGPSTLAAVAPGGPSRGGAGTVIGVVDSGISPESRLFADVPRLGRRPADFDGTCAEGEAWDPDICNGKLVAAEWFVDGFGEDNLRATAALSPRDTDGHGTQMASIAAGNAGVPVRVPGQSLGDFAGMAPQARLAVYKACWGAPDPADDGCATADLVTAIDRATADGVDVLSLSVGGPDEFDTVERALLGAAEADVVVVAAAGNDGRTAYAGHPSPWVTTVGGTTAALRKGQVVRGRAAPLTGAMVATRTVGPARLVLGARVGAPGSSRDAARVCTPGSLDAGAVADRVVVCERGTVGRVDKSRAVSLADGVGMVLVNDTPAALDEDFHSVPTVHLAKEPGRDLVRWLVDRPLARVSLRPVGLVPSAPKVAPWSSGGDPSAALLKPDLVAPATGILGGTAADSRGVAWDFVTGTSAATAYTSGVAAALLSRRGLSATAVRSALATTAQPLDGEVLAAGAGRVRAGDSVTPGLVYPLDATDYRAWLEGRRTELNTPSILLSGGQLAARRTVTNVGRRALYFSSRAVGFRRAVTVRPAALRLDPGESGTFRVSAAGRGRTAQLDDGYVVWRGASGTITRVPVLISR